MVQLYGENLDENFAALIQENIYLLPCGFLKLLYLNFKTLQSKLDVDTKIVCLKMAEYNIIVFSGLSFNISYLKAHF